MAGPDTVDLDLHGFAMVRIIDGGEADLAAVRRQLGPLPKATGREPDLVVRFVDRIPFDGRLRYLGAHDIGFTDAGFYVLRSRKRPVVVALPMADLGGPCEIRCERGVPAVPYLIATLNLAVLGKGVLPLHAAAFELDGVGTLVTGWSKGGKTELLMAAAGAGARYVGDEWVYLTEAGTMHGIPEPIRLWDWHLDQLPEIRARLSRGERTRLRGIRALRGLDAATPDGVRRRVPPNRLLHRAMPVLEGQLHVDVPPERLFGKVGDMSARIDRVLLVMSAAGEETTVEPVGGEEVARRMSASLLYERLDVRALYLQARYARPELHNPLLESLEERQRELLLARLGGRAAHLVTHPYPVDLHALLDAVRPVIA